MEILKKGSKGSDVRTLQSDLAKLGFDLQVDGEFGSKTEHAVRELQQMFGYTVDGLVGNGTQTLIAQQIGYGWNRRSPDAAERARQSQAKS